MRSQMLTGWVNLPRTNLVHAGDCDPYHAELDLDGEDDVNIMTIDDATFADAEIVFSREAGAEAGRVRYRAHVIDVHDAVVNCKENATLQWRHNERLKSPASRLFTQSSIHAQIKENFKVPPHWPLLRGFTSDR